MKIPFFHRVEEGEQIGFGFNYGWNERTKFKLMLAIPFWIQNRKSYIDFMGDQLSGIQALCFYFLFRIRNYQPVKQRKSYCGIAVFWKDLGPQRLIETAEAKDYRLYLERKTAHA